MNNRRVPLIVLAAGGTGGHVYPAESLATEMLTRGFRLALITDRRGYAYGGVLGNLDTYRVRAGGVAGKSVVSKILLALFQNILVNYFDIRFKNKTKVWPKKIIKT